jgi:glyoxylase-like metal-dependent hydrolase (beta-lactamase superfamily II)
LAANCHLLFLDAQHVVAVDIGDDANKLLEVLSQQQLTLTKILLTHGHYDHIAGVQAVQAATGAPVYLHTLDAPMLSDPRKNLALWLAPEVEFFPLTDYHTVEDGDCIHDGDAQITVLHTPGHTQGSVCYQWEDALFTGDTLFHLSRGRTDFPGGSDRQMLESFRRLKALEGDYRVYPGHDAATTLAYERTHNPTMRGIL